MTVRLYNNYIDYNGDRTFIAVANNCGAVYGECDFQCSVDYYLADSGETVSFITDSYRYNCNCNCDCNCL
jgi:hypothetical protein